MGIFLYLVSKDNFKAHLAAACAFGFFGTYNFAILLNFGGELIYPESESISSSILLMLNNGVSVVILEILSVKCTLSVSCYFFANFDRNFSGQVKFEKSSYKENP